MRSDLGPGIKRIPLEWVPVGWRAVRLNEVATFAAGGSLGLTKERNYRTGGYPAFSAAGQDGFVDKWEFDTEGVIVPSVGSVGRAYPAEGRWATLANTQIIFPRPDSLDFRFLAHRVDNTGYWPVSGTAQPFVKPSEIRRCWISLPPLGEQKRIVEILEAADSEIQYTEQLITKLKQMKQGLLHDLLTRGLDKDGEPRDPNRDPKQFKESPLGRIPADWEVAVAAEVCRRIEVGIVIRPAQYYRSSGVPMLRSANVREAGIDMSDLVFMSETAHAMMSKSAVVPGDLVTVRTGYPGTTAVIPEGLPTANCVDIIISRPGPRVRPDFLAIWINSEQGKGQVLRSQGGLAQQHFNVGELKRLLVPVPSVGEQERISQAIGSVIGRVDEELALARKLRSLKEGLMEDLLTGRVLVTNLLDGDAA